DTDNDGICDAQEAIDETNPNDACDPNNTDTDNDGICDNQEIIDGTDPNDGCDPNVNSIGCTPEIKVFPRVFLQGAFEEADGMMRDDLRTSNVIPMQNPYAEMPVFNHTGLEIIADDSVLDNAASVSDNIVDWVLVELRDAQDPAQVIATRAALVQRDGDVVDTDGVSAVSFPVFAGGYYLAVRHRNHLGAMTNEAVNLSAVPGEVFDFTDADLETYGNYARKVAGEEDELRVLWGGNAIADNQLIFQGANNDVDAIFFNILAATDNSNTDQNFINQGYYQADTNMDGRAIFQGNKNDIDFLIFFNVLTHYSNVTILVNYIIEEQLP
ncbi:MAG: thrombospondin type 3 repeat-containing protein, partial [Saprospiraceae bacterium]